MSLIDGHAPPIFFALWILAIIVALTIHEFSHGYSAYLLGDRTAKLDGRLSFNPIRHIDPIGMLMILVVGFGWAKPVMVNPYNLRNSKRDMAIISFAGPLSNFVLAFVMVFVFTFSDEFFGRGMVADYVLSFFWFLIRINVILGVFNLLPIPPLDGSKILGLFLPDHLYYRYVSYPYGIFILLGLMVTGITWRIIGPIINTIIDIFELIARTVLLIFQL